MSKSLKCDECEESTPVTDDELAAYEAELAKEGTTSCENYLYCKHCESILDPDNVAKET